MSAHPTHRVFEQAAPGQWLPATPLHPTGWLGFKVRRACRQGGGHFWHPADPMIAWACCNCGAPRDGFPKDGT